MRQPWVNFQRLSTVIAKCLKITRWEGIKLRRSYKRELHETLRIIRFSKGAKNKKQVCAAIRRVHTIAGTLFREVSKKISTEARQIHEERFAIFEHVLTQQRKDKNKVYSLHEPEIACTAEKEQKKRGYVIFYT